MFKKITSLLLIAALSTSCVSKKVYTDLENKFADLKKENRKLSDDLDDLTAAFERGEEMPVVPLVDAATAAFPTRRLDEAEARALGYGQRIPSAQPGRSDVVAAVSPDGTLVALLDESRSTAKARVTFAPAST